MNQTKSTGRKALSLFLSALMVLSAWVFFTPGALPTAAAAEAEEDALLGRFFSTDNVRYDAVSGADVISTVAGSDPVYNAGTGFTTISDSGYLQINKQDLYAGVSEDTGLSIALTYYSSKDEPHEHLISSGYSAYGATTARHFYVAGTYLGAGTQYRAMFMEWIGPGGDSQKTIRCYADGLTFQPNTTYDVVISFSVKEGVVYTVNGKRYSALYMDSSYAAQKENIRAFLNDVANYQYHYIGRSRWGADGNFAGGIRDLRLYRANLNSSRLLGRFFSTDNVWYDAATQDPNGLISKVSGGSAPAYNASTGYTTLNQNNYLQVADPGLFAGVTPSTGLTLSFSYRPTQDLHYVQLLSFGKNTYEANDQSDHFYIGATFHDTYHDSIVNRNPLIFEWKNGDNSDIVAYPEGLAFSAGATYDVEIAISAIEGVVYTVNGAKYKTAYYNGSKTTVSAFLNAVGNYRYGYIGRSRWTGDTQFAGDIKDLRFFRNVSQSTPLLGRFFSTNNVWYDAATKDGSGISWQTGAYPSYNAATGFTYLNGNNNNSYVSISNTAMFSGVSAETGLTIAFTYQPQQGDRYVQLLSFGANPYGDGTARHLYVGATYHGTLGGDTTPLFMEWLDSDSASHIGAWPQGLRFEANKIYDVIISISALEGVTYVVNGEKYPTAYLNSDFEGQKQYIAAFLNDVANYRYNYIGRSRWGADKSFDGNMKDLRFYGCALMEKQSLIDYNSLLFDDAEAGYGAAEMTARLTQDGDANKFTAKAYHYDEESVGGYANLVYASPAGEAYTGISGNGNFIEVKGTDFKSFTPLTAVMVRDGVHETRFPVQMETKRTKNTVWSNHIRYIAVNTPDYELIQDWQQTLDNGYSNGWTHWSGTVSNFGPRTISSVTTRESDNDDENNTSRFAWNSLRYTGNPNTSYFDWNTAVQFHARAYCAWTGSSGTDEGYFNTREDSGFYVINYEPVYSALPDALACYNEIAANGWMYTEESLAKAKATLVQLAASNPKNGEYAYASDASAAAAACGASITRAVVLLGNHDANAYTYDYEGLQLVKKQGTVTFADEDGSTLLAAQPYDYGTEAADITKPATPVKAQTNVYTYTFNGWEPEVGLVNAPEVVYTATYTEALREYAVTLNADGDGYAVTQNPPATVNYNGSATFAITLADGYTNSENPAVTATNGTVSASKSGNTITYTVSDITAATTVSVGDAAINSYTVTFVNGYTNATLKTEPVNHGSAATAPEAPAYIAIEGDGAKHMKFTGWDKAFGNITGDLTVTALYEEEIHSFGAYTNDGETHSRTCENCGYVESEAHDYAFDSFVWNGTTAQAKLVCSKDATHTKLVDAVMTSVPHEATCTEDAYTVYTATYGENSENKTVVAEGTKTGHTYAEPAEADWMWTKTGDTYTASVIVSCEHEDDTQTLTATVTLTEDVAATHLVDGHKTYTATATIGEQTFTATKTDVIEAEGHIWDYASENVTYAWTEDFSVCTATGPCKNCDGTTTVDASDITHSTTTIATCKTDGIETYVAAFEFDGLGDSAEKNLGKNAANHEGGTELRGEVEANCHTDGYTGDTYCLGCGEKIATGENTGKDMSKHDGNTEIRDDVEANCHTDGYTGDTYCLGCGNKIADGENTGKDMTKHDGETEVRGKIEANCHTDGYTGDTYCLGCNNKIADGENTGKDMSKHTGGTEVRDDVEANCHTDGYTGDTYCLGCGNKIATGENTGKDMTKHDGNTEIRDDVEANCHTDGYTGDTYCLGCGNKIATGENTGKDMTKHDGETELRNAKEPGYTFKGYTGDIHCASCDALLTSGSEIDKLNIDDNAYVAAAKTVSADAAADPTLYDEDDVAAVNDKLAALEAALAIDDNDVTVETIIAELKTLVESMDAIVYYNVTFTVDGVEVKTEQVRAGESATAPDEAEYINNGENHKRFSGWTGDYTNVTADITITATYETEGHNWIDGEITKPATCHETGTQEQICVCGAENVKTLPADSSNHVGGTGTKKEHETAGNCCTAPTWDEVEYCLGCGATLTTTPVTGMIDANAHNWGDWTVKTPATCENAGEEERVCANNPNHIETRPIEAKGHSYGTWSVKTSAGCETEGEEVRVCANDPSHTESRTIPAKGHNWGAWTVTKDATCKADGVESRICAACGTQENRAIKSTGAEHKWGAWVETKGPTCGETGEQTRTCSICGETETRPVEKLGHQWGEWVGDDGSAVTCTSGGTQHRECAVCGETETRSIPGGFGHHVANPNLRGEGYCEYCGEFRCNYCDRLEEFEDIDIIGFFYRIVHFFIHFAHMISYHSGR